MNKTLLNLAIACSLAFAAGRAMANGFALPDQDAFATARGEAVVATADNASAIYYNPAGISQLQGAHTRFGLYAIDYDVSFRPPSTAPNAGRTYDALNNYAIAPRFFFTSSISNTPLTLGLGVYAPFGGKISWPQDTGFRAVALGGELRYITVNPVLAWKILPSLSVAAGVMLNQVDLETYQGLRPFAGPLINYFRFTGSDWSVGANAGILWQPMEQLSFGASIRGPAKVTLQGQTEFEQQPFIPTTARPANLALTFPMSVAGGVSWRPTKKWNLEFDATYTDWSSFGRSTLFQLSPPFPLHANVPVTFNWRASWMLGAGVTRYFDNVWHASAGYCFNQNSVPDDYYTPLAADMDRHFLSIGAGYGNKGSRFNFDVAYQFGYGPGHTVSGSTPSSTPGQIAGQNADGKYSFISHAVSVSLGWRF